MSTIMWIALSTLAASGAESPGPGFTSLFNGKDFRGWHVSRTDHHGSTPDVRVENGILKLRQSPYGQGGLLLTDKRYTDFEIYLEVKAPPGCNSGIFLRSTEGGTAYQVELDEGRGMGNLLGENLSVSRPAEATALRSLWKDGAWNSFRIRMEGAAPHITEWVNGVQMWDVQEPRNDKIADETDGMIGLQAHWVSNYEPAKGSFNLPGSWKPGAAYEFRNISIKVLQATGVAAVDRAATPKRSNIDSSGIEFILIQAGKVQEAVFLPACPALMPELAWTADDVARCHRLAKQDASNGFPVTIAKPFYIGKFEITQAEWTKVMGRNPSVFRDDKGRRPVDSVTWEDAQAFVKALNKRERTHLYRLPTEFEWEYAGRAGGSGQVGWNDIRRQAVQGLRATADGVKPTTQPVGSKQPNEWGLYDMLGNVWEWVTDYYNEKTFPDPVPPVRGKEHVLKGAGFVSDVKNAIYATHGAGPGDGWDVGFRVVKDVEP